MDDYNSRQIMAENLEHYMRKHNLDRRELAQITGVSYSAVTDWLKARNYPRIDKIECMANYFGVSKSALVEKNTDGEQEQRDNQYYTLGQAMASADAGQMELLHSVLSLSDEQQQALKTLIEGMRGK